MFEDHSLLCFTSHIVRKMVDSVAIALMITGWAVSVMKSNAFQPEPTSSMMYQAISGMAIIIKAVCY